MGLDVIGTSIGTVLELVGETEESAQLVVGERDRGLFGGDWFVHQANLV
jgi:hypothetical protein